MDPEGTTLRIRTTSKPDLSPTADFSKAKREESMESCIEQLEKRQHRRKISLPKRQLASPYENPLTIKPYVPKQFRCLLCSFVSHFSPGNVTVYNIYTLCTTFIHVACFYFWGVFGIGNNTAVTFCSYCKLLRYFNVID